MANGPIAIKVLREIVKSVGVPESTFRNKKLRKEGPFSMVLIPISWSTVLRAWEATR